MAEMYLDDDPLVHVEDLEEAIIAVAWTVGSNLVQRQIGCLPNVITSTIYHTWFCWVWCEKFWSKQGSGRL